jgi:hypothetical protein
MIPIPISPWLYIRGGNGSPSTAVALPNVTSKLTRYSHTITATGGFESCTLNLEGTIEDGFDWLNQLGAAIICYSPFGLVMWEGQLSSVSFACGDESISQSFDDMANAVKVRYQPGIGPQIGTPFTTDTISISTYGRKELVFSGSGMQDSAALNLRDKLLKERRYPMAQRAGGAKTGAKTGANTLATTITLGCTGWFYCLDWLTTTSTTSTTAVTTTQVQNLITAYNATNAFFSTDYTDIAASGVSDTQWIDPDTTYREKIEKLLSFGNNSDQRLAYGVYENRKWKINQWAGANPGTIIYYRSLGSGQILSPGGGIVDYWSVRPDAMYQVLELIDPTVPLTADTVASYYIERVTCSIDSGGASIRLEPARSGELDVLLARIRN